MEADGKLNPEELDFFLKGNISLEKSSRSKPFPWLPDQGWEDIQRLMTVTPDAFSSLADDIERNGKDWKEVWRSNYPRLLWCIFELDWSESFKTCIENTGHSLGAIKSSTLLKTHINENIISRLDNTSISFLFSGVTKMHQNPPLFLVVTKKNWQTFNVFFSCAVSVWIEFIWPSRTSWLAEWARNMWRRLWSVLRRYLSSPTRSLQ